MPPPSALQNGDIELKKYVHIARLGLVDKNEKPKGKVQIDPIQGKRLWEDIVEIAAQFVEGYSNQQELETYLGRNDAPGAFMHEAGGLLCEYGSIWESDENRVASETCKFFIRNPEDRQQLQYRLRCCLAWQAREFLRKKPAKARRSESKRSIESVLSSVPDNLNNTFEDDESIHTDGGRITTPGVTQHAPVNSGAARSDATPVVGSAQRTRDVVTYEDADLGVIANLYPNASGKRKRTHDDIASREARPSPAITESSRAAYHDDTAEHVPHAPDQSVVAPSVAMVPPSRVQQLNIPRNLSLASGDISNCLALTVASNRTAPHPEGANFLSKQTLQKLLVMLKDRKPGPRFAELSSSVENLNACEEDLINSSVTEAFPDESVEIMEAFESWSRLHAILETFRDASGFAGGPGAEWREHLAKAVDDEELRLIELSTELELSYARMTMHKSMEKASEDWIRGQMFADRLAKYFHTITRSVHCPVDTLARRIREYNQELCAWFVCVN